MSTFGKTAIGANTFQVAAQFQQASKYTLTENGTVTSISMYLESRNLGSNQTLKAVCWADSSGLPGALKITSNASTVVNGQAAGWVVFSLPANVALTAGDYWLGWIADATTIASQGYSDTLASARQFKGQSYASGPSDPFGTPGGNAADQVSIYATYTPDVVVDTGSSSSQSNLIASQARRPHAATARSHRR